MKSLGVLSAGLVVSLILAGCSGEPLKFRNLLEADQYLRNNIPTMDWKEFELLLREGKNEVTEEDFQYLKKELSAKYSSSHVVVDNKLYRFRKNQKLMYMTEWEEIDNLLYLKEISYINQLD